MSPVRKSTGLEPRCEVEVVERKGLMKRVAASKSSQVLRYLQVVTVTTSGFSTCKASLVQVRSGYMARGFKFTILQADSVPTCKGLLAQIYVSHYCWAYHLLKIHRNCMHIMIAEHQLSQNFFV